jgi:hypothetical protein
VTEAGAAAYKAERAKAKPGTKGTTVVAQGRKATPRVYRGRTRHYGHRALRVNQAE